MSTDNGCRPHNLINCSRCMAERERLAREARISELEARVEELTARLADMRRSKVYWRTAALRERELTRRQQRADSREHEFHAQRDVFRDLLSRWLEAFDARLFAGPLIASTKRALAPVEEAAPQRDHARHDWQCIFCGDWSAVPYRIDELGQKLAESRVAATDYVKSGVEMHRATLDAVEAAEARAVAATEERDRFAELVKQAQAGKLPWRDDAGNDRGTPAGTAIVMGAQLTAAEARVGELEGERDALDKQLQDTQADYGTLESDRDRLRQAVRELLQPLELLLAWQNLPAGTAHPTLGEVMVAARAALSAPTQQGAGPVEKGAQK